MHCTSVWTASEYISGFFWRKVRLLLVSLRVQVFQGRIWYKEEVDKDIAFARSVIKGKIVELVFEFMFREAGQYTIIPFGYEYTQPELAQHRDLLEEKDILDTLRNTPDFIITSMDRKEVYFVEVKYRREVDTKKIKSICEKLVEKWEHAYLFLATPEGFFYEPCHTVIHHDGVIGGLFESHVPRDIQTKYLALLREFVQ